MKKIKNNLGIALFIVLTLAPLPLWLLTIKPASKFSSLAAAVYSLGQLAGLVGLAMFALVIILSARLKFMENYFAGQNRIYIFHHLFGALAFLLLLAHPLLLLLQYLAVSVTSAALFMLPGGNLAKDLGIFALLLMILLLILTFFVKLKYQVWKFTHKFLGLAFFLGGLHAFLIGSDLARWSVLKIYLLTLTGLALAAYGYHSVFGKFLVKKYSYAVITVKLLADDIIEIVLEPKDKAMKFQAGQFIFINFLHPNFPAETHPFTIAAGDNRHLKLIIKNLGDYTARLKELRPGDLAKIEGPFGKFSYQSAGSNRQIWIAGGIGVTPFLAMAENLAADQTNDYQIDLYYCVRNQKEAVMLDRLNSISGRLPDLRIMPFFSEASGRINAQYIEQQSGGLNNKDIFLCGPGRFMNDLKKQFLKLNVFKSRLHSEEFKLYN